MAEYLLIILIIAAVPLTIFYKDYFIERRRKKIGNQLFPHEWEKTLLNNTNFYRHLTSAMQEKLKKDIQVFINEKNYEGCAGFKITDEVKVTVAAQAMILFINRESNYYPKLVSILVYPGRYLVRSVRHSDGLVRDDVRIGESFSGGVVVLSWEDVTDTYEGENVAIHEFSHQLDQEKGVANGVPVLENMDAYKEWANVFQSEYDLLNKNMKARMDSVMRNYGMTNPAEFFAVATELFFEKPLEFRDKHENLYNEMKKYYKTDPCEWSGNGGEK